MCKIGTSSLFALACLLVLVQAARAGEPAGPPAPSPAAMPTQPPFAFPVVPPAAAWTGKEMVVWDGKRCFALDPAKCAWRIHPAPPIGEPDLDVPSLFSLRNGGLIAAFWGFEKRKPPRPRGWSHLNKVGLRVDLELPEDRVRTILHVFRLDPGAERWTRLIELRVRSIADLPELEDGRHLVIGGVTEPKEGVVLFVNSNMPGCPTLGIRVLGSDAWKLVARGNAPDSTGTDTAVVAGGGKVLYFGYGHRRCNLWSVWDEASDTWTVLQPCRPRYDFAHAFSGDALFVFGGAEGTGEDYIVPGGSFFRFAENLWSDLPLEGGPSGRRSASSCWTGTRLVVWGGLDDEGEAERGCTGKGAMLDPASKTWSALPREGAPSPRERAACFWTGREVLLWGGRCGYKWLADGGAFDPERGAWRPLPATGWVKDPATGEWKSIQ